MSSILSAVFVLSTLSAVFGALLSYASYYLKVEKNPIVEKINAILPQSQCGQCDYLGCRPYADAVGNNGEMINKCVPGGEQTMLKLAAILNVDPLPLGVESDLEYERKVAWIDEENCIGCTKCIQLCPVDAIVGIAHAMHTVLSDVCTGCNLCVAPCPTDCIKMHPVVNMTTRGKWDLQKIPIQVTTVENHA